MVVSIKVIDVPIMDAEQQFHTLPK